MEPEILQALLENEMAQINEQRLLEIKARNVLSDFVEEDLLLMYPKVSREFQEANFNFVNELQRGAGEIVDQVAAARVNWTGPTQDSGVEEHFSPELRRMLAVDALTTGKFAIYPKIDEDGEFVFEVPNGFLYPVFAPGNALKVKEVLQVVAIDGGSRYQVTRFSRGLVQVYPPVADWLKFADGQPEDWPQPHAADRLPLVFVIVRRNAHRTPTGLVAEALPGNRRHMKSAVNRNAVQDKAGFPERVVKSDTYLNLALARVTRPGVGLGTEDPALTELKKTGANQLKLLGTDDVYEIMPGATLAPHIEAETTDKQALLDFLRSPDLSGGNVTEVALAERQGKARALIIELTTAIARAGTEACALASGIGGSNIAAGIEISLTPVFPAENAKRPTIVADLFSKSALKLSHVYTELQSVGFNSISDEDIEAQKALENGDALPDLGEEVVEMTRADATATLRALEAAATEARTFFGIDPLFDTPIRADMGDEGTTKIFVTPGYFFRPISVNLDYYKKNPGQIRGDMAHEIAHLVTDEIASIMQRFPAEWGDEGSPLATLFVDALEKATVRIEKIYARERRAKPVRRRRTAKAPK